jgi:hypothetical protein
MAGSVESDNNNYGLMFVSPAFTMFLSHLPPCQGPCKLRYVPFRAPVVDQEDKILIFMFQDQES